MGTATAAPRLHAQQHQTLTILTAIAFVNWWEGLGSKAHQFLQLAREADPAYRVAKLSDLMIGSGMVAGWNMDIPQCAPSRGVHPDPHIHRRGVAPADD